MKINREQKLQDGVYSVSLKFGEYGRQELTSEKEKEIIENFGVKIAYKDIEFKGNFKVEKGNVIESDQVSDDEVKLALNNVEIPLNENLLINYSVKVDSINESMLGTHLDTKEKVAAAMCVLFRSKVEKEITKRIEEAIAKTNDFEKEEMVTL